MADVKICKQCQRELPLDSYHRHASSAGGRATKCKDCTRKRTEELALKKGTCTVEGCDRVVQSRGLCRAHYARSRTGRDMDTPIRSFDPDRGCLVRDCERPHGVRGYCDLHYTQLRRDEVFFRIDNRCKHSGCDRPAICNGWCGAHDARDRTGRDMDTPMRSYDPGRGCSMQDCARPHGARGYCDQHYEQLRLDGAIPDIIRQCGHPGCTDPLLALGYCSKHYQRVKNGSPIDGTPLFPMITVDTAHKRLRVLWGPARRYSCIGCDKPAAHLAYDGTDPTQILGQPGNGGSLVWYSLYPEFYMPMCIACHNRRDGAAAAAELREYRQWKFATRMKLADMAIIKTGVPSDI